MVSAVLHRAARALVRFGLPLLRPVVRAVLLSAGLDHCRPAGPIERLGRRNHRVSLPREEGRTDHREMEVEMTSLKPVEAAWQRFGSMINTVLILAALIGLIWKGGAYTQQVEADITKNAAGIDRVEREQGARWTAHDALHKDRLAEVKANEARTDERFKAIEGEVRKIERLDYRLTVTEQTSNTTANAIKELQSTLSETSGDLKVVREILQRLEAGQRRGSNAQ